MIGKASPKFLYTVSTLQRWPFVWLLHPISTCWSICFHDFDHMEVLICKALLNCSTASTKLTEVVEPIKNRHNKTLFFHFYKYDISNSSDRNKDLRQCLSNFNVHSNHTGILLKCTFWFSNLGWGLIELHFWQAPAELDALGAQTIHTEMARL